MNSASHHFAEDDSTTPALRFERLFGLRDIGRRWVMPGGLTLAAMERDLKRDILSLADIDAPPSREKEERQRHRLEKGRRYAEIFNTLNPDLRRVQTDWDNWKHLRGFIHGATSGFNADDINEWIHGRVDAFECDLIRKRIFAEFQKDPAQSWYPDNLREKFSSHANPPALLLAQLNWIPCTKTILRINEQLDLKRVP